MTKTDWVLITLVASVSLILLGLRYLPVSDVQVQARIELEGKTVRILNLQKVDDSVVTMALKGGQARLELKGGAIRLLPMPDSVCPRKICWHTGWIKRPGETIICVPNRLIIRLVGEGVGGVDAVTK